jgi:D-arabinose 1-dehydrogenase-like Zn-dependent alcohol dehydrogenase
MLRELGGDAVVGLDHDEVDRIRGLVLAIGVDIVLDNHASNEMLAFGLDALDLGGQLIMIGNGADRPGDLQAIAPLKMIPKELSIRAARGQTRWDQMEALRLAGCGQVSMPIAKVLPLGDIRIAHEHQAPAATSARSW